MLRQLGRGHDPTNLAALRRGRRLRFGNGFWHRPGLCSRLAAFRVVVALDGCRLDRAPERHGPDDRRLGAAHLPLCSSRRQIGTGGDGRASSRSPPSSGGRCTNVESSTTYGLSTGCRRLVLVTSIFTAPRGENGPLLRAHRYGLGLI